MGPAVPGIIACAGTGGPAPEKCDGVPGSLTGAENPVSFLAHKVFGSRSLYSQNRHVELGTVLAVVRKAAGTIVTAGIFTGLALLLLLRIRKQARSRSIYDTLEEPIQEEMISSLE